MLKFKEIVSGMLKEISYICILVAILIAMTEMMI